MSLLIIEDDEPFAELLRHWLGERKIRFAQSLAAARDMIKKEIPKFILVDLSLPDSTAFQTLAKIRSLREESKDAVVIVITGYPNHRDAALSGGADVFLDKDEKEGGCETFFKKLSNVLVNPPRPPNEKVHPAVEVVEKNVRDIVT